MCCTGDLGKPLACRCLRLHCFIHARGWSCQFTGLLQGWGGGFCCAFVNERLAHSLTHSHSTCKRISQKLLRNVVKFLGMIYDTLGVEHMPIIRSNCEEIVLCGPEGRANPRICNSYPSKVSFAFSLFITLQQSLLDVVPSHTVSFLAQHF